VTLLDTHAWIWLAAEPTLLSQRARKAIDKASQALALSSISCWELAMLVERGRIALDRDPQSWIETSLAEFRIELLPLTPAIAVRSTQLGPGFHGDPADRLIVATALVHSATIVSKDQRLRDYPMVATVW
jgi:PIN domain nuclease of toxin-antitoxin system